jgi:hypothetical protein
MPIAPFDPDEERPDRRVPDIGDIVDRIIGDNPDGVAD